MRAIWSFRSSPILPTARSIPARWSYREIAKKYDDDAAPC